MQIKLGNKVIGKKTGPLKPSIAYNSMSMSDFLRHHKLNSIPPMWLDLYPNCGERSVIFGKFDEPTTTLSFEDVKSHFDKLDDILLIELRKHYDLYLLFVKYEHENYGKTYYIAYPEQDVSVVDEDVNCSL